MDKNNNDFDIDLFGDAYKDLNKPEPKMIEFDEPVEVKIDSIKDARFHGDDDIEDSLTAIEIIKHSYDLIKEYLNQVVGSVDVSADNKARAMYSEIVDSIKAMEAPDDAVDRKDDLPDIIVKYML